MGAASYRYGRYSAHYTLYQLKLAKHLLPRDLRSLLVKTLVMALLDYCCAILTDITGEQNLRLDRALNSCVRFIFDARYDEHVSVYYRTLGWLRVGTRRKYLLGGLLYKIIATKQPDILFNHLVFRNTVSSRTTRAASDLLDFPPCRTELFRQSFRSAASGLWNGLPQSVRSLDSLTAFCGGLYAWLLEGDGC